MEQGAHGLAQHLQAPLLKIRHLDGEVMLVRESA
jgi:hypothetical protein